MYPYNFNIPYNIIPRISYMKNPRIPITFTNKIGLFPKLTNKLHTFKNINWSNIINNTSKTLNVINQTIPIVKQTKPMLHNMRSILKVASVFRDETTNTKNDKKYNNNTKKKEVTRNNSSLPNFFV